MFIKNLKMQIFKKVENKNLQRITLKNKINYVSKSL